MPYIAKSAWHPVIVHLVGTGDVVLVVLAGQTNSATTLPISGDRPWWSNATARAGYAMMTTTSSTTSMHNCTMPITTVTMVMMMMVAYVWIYCRN